MIGAYNPFLGQRLRTDARNVTVDRSFIAHYVISAALAVAAAVNNVKTAVTLADGTTTTLTTADITQPATSRVLSITGNAVTAVGDVVITGTDISGAELVETIVSTGAATVIGTKAFASISTIVLPARGAAADTISIGLADKFGIPYKLAQNTVLLLLRDGTSTTVSAGSNFSGTVLADNYIDPTAAMNGTQIDLYFIV